MQIDARDHPAWDGHREVHYFEDEAAGLRAYVAIHTAGPLGIAGGGCRVMPYERLDDALGDALRLSKAMTRKMLFTGAQSGGAKCVVVADPARDATPALFEALGRAIGSLRGRFVAGADVGTSSRDLIELGAFTPYVSLPSSDENVASDLTARGVVAALRCGAEARFGSDDLSGRRVAVQGLGKVGAAVARMLRRGGADLVVADLDRARTERVARELSAAVAAPDAIAAADVDVYAPCALGEVVDDDTLETFRCALIAGSANDQLARPELAEALFERGILYVPDYVANMGGVLAEAHPRQCAEESGRRALAEHVARVTREVLRRADAASESPERAAERWLEELAAARAAKNASLPRSAARAAIGTLWKRPRFARSVMRARAAFAHGR
jgi:leucine dehydrogenase